MVVFLACGCAPESSAGVSPLRGVIGAAQIACCKESEAAIVALGGCMVWAFDRVSRGPTMRQRANAARACRRREAFGPCSKAGRPADTAHVACCIARSPHLSSTARARYVWAWASVGCRSGVGRSWPARCPRSRLGFGRSSVSRTPILAEMPFFQASSRVGDAHRSRSWGNGCSSSSEP